MGVSSPSSMPLMSSSHAMVPANSYGYDHRLTGPYGPGPALIGGCSSFDNGMTMDGGIFDDCGYGYGYGYDGRGRGRRRHKSSSRYVYHHSSKPATNCTVM